MGLLTMLPSVLLFATDTARADTATLMTATLPTARHFTSAVWDGANAYVFGGYDGSFLNQIVRYNPSTNTVTIMTAILPTGRSDTSAVWDGSNAYVFGGQDGALLNEIVRYNPATNTVTTMTATLPTARYVMSAVWDGTNADIFGGWDGSYLKKVVRYNPSTNTVTTSMTAALPTGRVFTSAVWDGSNAYVFGGQDPSDLNQIVRYTPNGPPVAVIAAVADAECNNGGQTVTLDGAGSFDPDGDAITFAWSAPGITFNDPTSATPNALFPLGSTMVTLTATDPFGASGTATSTVRVVDTLPPMVSIARPIAGAAYVNDVEFVHGFTQTPILAVGSLTVVANAQDQCGVVRVDFASTTGAAGSDAEAPYTFAWNPAPTASGPVTVTATVLDVGGHTASAAVDFIQVGTAV